jgi:excisionase family DNA binding protein
MYQTHRRWWTVADAAQVLRVHPETLYDACRVGDFPHERWGGSIRIPCEALRMTHVPDAATAALVREFNTERLDDVDQLALPLDPSCLVPARTYRNGERKTTWAYEAALWGHNGASRRHNRPVTA